MSPADPPSALDDPLLGPYFAAVGQGQLVVQRCDSCHQLRWPPLEGCPECRAQAASWVPVEASGVIWSYVVYHRGFSPVLAAQIPYTVAMVQLDAGPYLVGRLLDGDEPPRVGDRVRADFGVDDDGIPSVRWRTA